MQANYLIWEGLFYSIPLHNFEYLANSIICVAFTLFSYFSPQYIYGYCQADLLQYIWCAFYLQDFRTNIQTVHKYTAQHSLWIMIYIEIYSSFHGLQMKGIWEPNINVWFRFMYPRNETARPCYFQTELLCSVSQFSHSCICERFIYFQDWCANFAAAK